MGRATSKYKNKKADKKHGSSLDGVLLYPVGALENTTDDKPSAPPQPAIAQTVPLEASTEPLDLSTVYLAEPSSTGQLSLSQLLAQQPENTVKFHPCVECDNLAGGDDPLCEACSAARKQEEEEALRLAQAQAEKEKHVKRMRMVRSGLVATVVVAVLSTYFWIKDPRKLLDGLLPRNPSPTITVLVSDTRPETVPETPTARATYHVAGQVNPGAQGAATSLIASPTSIRTQPTAQAADLQKPQAPTTQELSSATALPSPVLPRPTFQGSTSGPGATSTRRVDRDQSSPIGSTASPTRSPSQAQPSQPSATRPVISSPVSTTQASRTSSPSPRSQARSTPISIATRQVQVPQTSTLPAATRPPLPSLTPGASSTYAPSAVPTGTATNLPTATRIRTSMPTLPAPTLTPEPTPVVLTPTLPAVLPTLTAQLPTATLPVPPLPTVTLALPTLTPQLPTTTSVVPLPTAQLPTATIELPTATVHVPVPTAAVPTLTPAPPTGTPMVPTATVPIPQVTNTQVPIVPTITPVLPTATLPLPTATTLQITPTLPLP